MTLMITIDTDNDAFTADPDAEVCRILCELVKAIEHEGVEHAPFTLRDVNGNTVGRAALADGVMA